MVRTTRVLILIFAVAGCGSSPGGGPGGGGSSTTAGWKMVVSSGSSLVSPGSNGGVTNGPVSGEFAVTFLDANDGWAVGNLGEILKTTDGGQSVTAMPTPTSGTLYDVFAVSSTEVWIAGKDSSGSSIWKSTSGGSTWSQEINTASLSSSSIPANRVDTYADRIQRLLVTPSGAVAAVGRVGNDAYFILLRDATTGDWYEFDNFATGHNDILWGITAVAGNPQDLLAVGNNGLVLVSVNGGTRWIVENSGTSQALYKVACHGPTCLAVGAGGTAILSRDGGATWNALITGTSADLTAVAFSPSSSTVWVGGDGGVILRSTDLGATWKAQDTHTIFPIQDIFMVSDTVGWAASAFIVTNQGGLLMTNSGGEE